MLSGHPLHSLLAQPSLRPAPRAGLLGWEGLWKGALHGRGVGAVPFTLRHEDADAGAQPSIAFPSAAMPPVRLGIVEASVTTYHVVTEPYIDPALGTPVTLHLNGARRGNRFAGTFQVRRDDGTVAREGSVVAARYASAASVNYRW